MDVVLRNAERRRLVTSRVRRHLSNRTNWRERTRIGENRAWFRRGSNVACRNWGLARRTGIAQGQISDIEAGYRKPTWDGAVKLIAAGGGKVAVQKPRYSA